jgi:hypothetical protein
MVHHAKVDRWVAVLLGGLALLEVAAGTAVLAAGFVTGTPPLPQALGIGLTLVSVGVIMGLMLWGCYRTRYEVTPSDLMVRFGPFRTAVPLDAIVEVFPTDNPLSAPAPSLDRLRINYRRANGRMGFALISPKDKEGFVRDLAAAAPRLRSAGDGPLRLNADAPAWPSRREIKGP